MFFLLDLVSFFLHICSKKQSRFLSETEHLCLTVGDPSQYLFRNWECIFSFFLISFVSFRNSECFLFVSEVFCLSVKTGHEKYYFLSQRPPLVLMINGRLLIFSNK